MPIRKARESDLENLLQIVQIWDNEEENELPTDLNKIEEYISDGSIYLYFEEEDDEPLGVMILADNFKSFNLSTLYVHPDHRSEGIGSQLLTKLTKLLDTNCAEAFLEVDAHNPAIELYERFGFKEDNRYKVSSHRIAMTRPVTPQDYLSL